LRYAARRSKGEPRETLPVSVDRRDPEGQNAIFQPGIQQGITTARRAPTDLI
jgi:hypothetical protein